MRVKINGYDLTQYHGGLASSQIFSQISPATGRAKLQTKSLHIEGEVNGANQAALDTQIGLLETAVRNLGKIASNDDVGLTLNDGTTASKHWLDNGTSEGGIRLVHFEWLPCIGSQYATRRNFVLVCEADYLVSGESNLVQYEEQIQTVGTGGPIFIYQPVLAGSWRKVHTHVASTMTLVQSGMNVGFAYAEAANPPLFHDEHVERRSLAVTAGQWVNGKKRNFVRTWTYQFESNNIFNLPS